MILTAHQPVYLPWLGLFKKIALADRYVSLNNVQYQRSDWNHRNQVRINGEVGWLSVPVKKKGYLGKKYIDIEIDNSQPWAKKHWCTLLFNYKKSPYFKKYIDFFEDTYQREWKTLVALNEYMLKWFLRELKINLLVESVSDKKVSGTKDDLIVNLCECMGANVFIFGKQGSNYVDVQKFTTKNVIPYFQEYQHPKYNQGMFDFVPYLSVVDLLFNEGDNSFDVIMSNNVDKNAINNFIKI